MVERLLTPEEAAERLAVNPKSVREWLRQGRLKGIKAGRLWRVRERDLEALFGEDEGDSREERVREIARSDLYPKVCFDVAERLHVRKDELIEKVQSLGERIWGQGEHDSEALKTYFEALDDLAREREKEFYAQGFLHGMEAMLRAITYGPSPEGGPSLRRVK